MPVMAVLDNAMITRDRAKGSRDPRDPPGKYRGQGAFYLPEARRMNLVDKTTARSRSWKRRRALGFTSSTGPRPTTATSITGSAGADRDPGTGW